MTSKFHRHKPLRQFFCCEMSSFARSKPVQGTTTVNIICWKSTDDDVAEVLQAKDRPPPRTRAPSSSTNCFSLLNGRDPVYSLCLQAGFRKVSSQRFELFLLLVG